MECSPGRPERQRRRPLALLLIAIATGPAVAAGPGPGSKVDFNRDIRPILADNCLACHGPDEPKRKAKLRLDTPEGARAPAASGSPAIVPGKPKESELYLRITSDDGEERMPPVKSGKTLTAEQTERLKVWIEQGAPFEKHWAFIPPKRPTVPEVRNPVWCRNPIDAFVLARLEKEGLAPSPEADTLTRLRRLSLDLIGLPPTIAEADAALAESGPDGDANRVARLLDAPAYGERWGRIWLDAARYADSDGYEKDKLRQVWSYRDWVIQALNRDLPYDRFVIEQIAGDLLPNATQDQVVATGFLRNSMINEEGGVDPEQFRMEAMFDRMEAIGKGVLGLTIQCAQCHTHKFDPFTHEDYYKMFAYVNNTHEANVAVYSPDEQMKRADLFQRIREIEGELQHQTSDWAQRMAAWEKAVSSDQPEWTVVEADVDDISTGGQKHQRMDDGSLLAGGYAPTKFQTKFTVKTNVQGITAFRLELLNDPNLPLGGPGRSIKGTGALTEFLVDAAPADGSAKPERIKLVKATADVNPPEAPLEAIFDDRSKTPRVTGPIEYAIDGKAPTAWTFDLGPGRRNQPRKAVFVAEKPIAHAGGSLVTFYLNQSHGGWNSDDNQTNNLGRFRFSVTTAPDATADPLPKGVREILAIAAEQRTPAQVATVFSYWRTTVPEWKAANDRIEALWREHPEGASQLVFKARETPRMTHMLIRGDFLKPGKTVAPGVPEFLNALPPDAPADRLTFARWLADRNAPTTARAIVNRVWQAYFGIGLVSTSEDLGTQSEPPSHPELLDWLAVEFMEQGWSLKNLHRLIVSSATYRQSSKATPELLARDPYNRLLTRGPRFRVDAEVVRDVALAASGLLNPKIGGPSVFPPAPEFLFQPPTSYGPKVWPVATGPDRYRRALYTFRYRSVPYPMLQTFDSPNGDVSCVRRTRSNTPLQALTILNEPTFLECARALALRTLQEGGDTDSSQLTYAFRRCLARTPTAREATVLLDLLRRQEERFGRGGAKPWELAATDPNQPPTLPAGATPVRLAAWTAVSRVLLNLDETISKE
ncbi:Planctomycete cytochrome C [Singulisphaera sp. GP187]|uniref:PSD1 and planctomycete cytochrome C domain-containing protein n=1 Tax=Singulisphaera sp. GP187 TaxID=1882752 RepID=UPI000925FBD2|nr:PSD1 and planctomycete cytochrome C domain-containing protein [Singulisphaera sp. GP187]SIO24182.1 Planctomycete cytochrome C [Singulisphaera sp. GP187]